MSDPHPEPSAAPATPSPPGEPTAPPPKRASPPQSHPLAKFPAAIRSAHAHFLATGDVASLDAVVLAVVLDHQPSVARKPEAGLPADSARLIDDLGFDSLALAEIVFFLEDLYKLTITNEELKNVTSMGEIRAFVRDKVAEAAKSVEAAEAAKLGDTPPA